MTKELAKVETRELAPQEQRFNDLRAVLESPLIMRRLKETCAKHLTPERLIRLTLSATSRNPRLLECTPISIAKSVMDCAALGLEPMGRYGGAYLVPYWNSKIKPKGGYEAQMQTDYRGEIALVTKSGRVVSVWPRIVYANEIKQGRFDADEGSEPRLVHRPIHVQADRGPRMLAYAVAKFASGEKQWRILNTEEIEARRMKSQAGSKGQGPWSTDTEAMWLKTAVRAMCSLLSSVDIPPEYADHVSREEARDAGEEFAPIVDLGDRTEPELPPSATTNLEQRLLADREAQRAIDEKDGPQSWDEREAEAIAKADLA